MISFPQKIFFFVSFLFLNLSFFQTYSQQVSFSTDKQEYLEELYSFYKRKGTKDVSSIDMYRTVLGIITQDDQDFISEITNHFMTLPYQKQGLINSFLLSLIAIANRDQNYLTYYLENAYNFILENPKKFKLYVQNMASFAEDLVLSKSSQFFWQAPDAEILDLSESFDVILNNITLSCISKNDSFKIEKTAGVYHLLNGKFLGEGGSILISLDIEKEPSHVTVGKYEIDLKKRAFSSDSCMLYYPLLKKETPMLGKYYRSLQFGKKNSTVLAQTFITNEIQEIPYEDGKVLFKGLFNLNKNIISLTSDDFEPATMEFFNGEKKVILIEASKVFLKDSITVAYEANTTIYFDNPQSGEEETITGSYTTVTYDHKTKELKIGLDAKKKLSKHFFSTYHKVEISSQNILWRLGVDSLWLENEPFSGYNNTSVISARFFSFHLFQEMNYNNYSHPMVKLRNFADYYGGYELGAKHFGKFVNISESASNMLMMMYSRNGFTYYRHFNKTFDVTDKLYTYLKAVTEKTDFDQIGFTTKNVRGEYSASMDMKNMELKTVNVDPFALERNENIVIYPDSNGVVLKENLNMTFGGKVSAGKLTLYSEKFDFSYNDFWIFSQKIDSTTVHIKQDIDSLSPETSAKDAQKAVQMKSKLYDLKGRILIDKPDNKSGKIKNEEYPIFKSEADGFIYYDNISEGGYPQDSFKFITNPFEIENLKSPEDERFEISGTLKTSGIIPDLDISLSVQKDLTFGFSDYTFEKEEPLYNNLGSGKLTLSLNNQGLKAKGDISYKKLAGVNTDFRFYMNSAKGSAKGVLLEKTSQATGFEVTNVAFVWNTGAQDNFVTKTKEDPFFMYNDELSLLGETKYEGDSLTGKGTSKIQFTNISSKSYHFKEKHAFVDTGDFFLTKEEAGFDFLSTGVGMDVDWEQRKIFFNTEKEKEYNYSFGKGKITVFHVPTKYDMGENVVYFTIDKRKDISEKNGFVEYQIKNKEKIVFFAGSSKLDIGERKLLLSEVADFNIADIDIQPKNRGIEFNENAILQDFENATFSITSPDSSFVHLFEKAKIKLLGANRFTGSGSYVYKTPTIENQYIYFPNLKVSNGATEGRAYVSDEIELSKDFNFKGKVNFVGNQKFMTFTGGVELTNVCSEHQTKDLSIKAQIDPKNLVLDISGFNYSEPKTKIFSGFYFSAISGDIYPTFLSPKESL